MDITRRVRRGETRSGIRCRKVVRRCCGRVVVVVSLNFIFSLPHVILTVARTRERSDSDRVIDLYDPDRAESDASDERDVHGAVVRTPSARAAVSKYGLTTTIKRATYYY